MPDAFLIPRSALVRAFKRLVIHRPTCLTAFHAIHDARLVAAVRVVVASEEISVIVERKFLWIAKTRVIQLEFTSIRIHAKNGTCTRIVKKRAITCGHVISTITNRPVDFSVVAKRESVHVMTAQCNAHAVTRRVFQFELCNAVTINIAHAPEIWNVRVEDVAIKREKPRA